MGVAPLTRRAGASSRSALEAVLTKALAAGPVAVSFSGGRDSSAMLAIAAHVARREQLPLPLPVTLEVAGSADADEREWQDLVLAHLGLTGTRVVLTEEMDLCGPVASDILLNVGLLWPANSYLHDAVLRAAPGATLVTGIGGDELLSRYANSGSALVLAREARPTIRNIGGVVESLVAPGLSRRRTARGVADLPWLSASARTRRQGALAWSEAPAHTGWRGALRSYHRSGYVAATRVGFDALAAHRGARALHPLLEPAVLAALQDEGGRTGFPSRTDAMRRLVGDLLPEPVLGRVSKATFGDLIWRRESAQRRRDPQLLGALRDDAELAPLLDLEALSREWDTAQPHFGTALLLHAAHLALLSGP